MKRVFYAILAATLLVSAASAQFGGPKGPPPGGPHGPGAFGPGVFGPGMHAGKVITGAPYSATATNTFTQTLANGNTIQRTMTASVGRDSSGRTYEQQTMTGGPLAAGSGPTTITFINDPTAGYAYVLNATTKVATRRPLHAPPSGGRGPDGFVRGQRPANPNVVETPLSPTTMNGVSVTGKTITHTIPAGQVGNAQAIVSTDTVWFSPDLQVVVAATRDDPRTGTSNYALTSITPGDPPAANFQVPSDYTVQDAKGFNRAGRGARPPQ